MFLRGKQPALKVPLDRVPALCVKLERAGYTLHRGPRTRAPGELEAWVRRLSPDRQVHVQLVKGQRDVRVFAHTEPAGFTLRHLFAALLDQVSYQAGAKVLKADLAKVAA